MLCRGYSTVNFSQSSYPFPPKPFQKQCAILDTMPSAHLASVHSFQLQTGLDEALLLL